jgi:AraC-like DNA-binding protein
MIELNNFFQMSDEFPKIEVERGFRFVEYRSYEASTNNQVFCDRSFIVFVLQGEKTINTGGTSYTLNEEKALFLNKGGYTMSEIPETRGLFQSLLFFIDDRFLQQFAKKHADLLPPASPLTTTAIPISITSPLAQFYRSVLPYFNTSLNEARRRGLNLKFEELLLQLIAEPKNRDFSAFLRHTLNNKPSLEQVMEQNFHKQYSLTEFAQLTQRSLSTFKRDFQLTFGETPGRWLLSRRLKHASYLLKSSNLNISQIAEESGFENASHFSQAFKAHYSCSPSSWRKTQAAYPNH